MILYKSLYNFLLGRPFSIMLDAVASLIHLKFKYHNVHDKPLVTIWLACLEHGGYINSYNETRKGKDKKNVIKINVVYFTKQIK